MMSFIYGAQWANINTNSYSTPGRQSRKQVQAFPHPACGNQVQWQKATYTNAA